MLTFQASSSLTSSVAMLHGMVSIGERLKRAREEAGLTQDDLARKIGMTRTGIALVESGRSTSLNAANLTKAAKHLGKSALWLATGSGPENSIEPIAEVLESLGEQDRQQVFDFLLYKIERAPVPYASENTAKSYAEMIERIREDMAEKKPR